MKFRFVPLLQGSDKWLEFKRFKIGSSDAASVNNTCRWESPLQCWERHMFNLQRPTSPAMERGKEMEAKAREWINKELEVNYEPKVIQMIHNEDLIASLDGYYEKDGKHYLLEIKCPGINDHLQAVEGNIPLHYYAQLQHQMMVADVGSMKYLSFDGKTGIILNVCRDLEYCKRLFDSEMQFLALLSDFKPPSSTDRDWIKMHDPDRSKRLNRLRKLRDLRKRIDIKEKEIEEEIQKNLPHVRCLIDGVKIQKINKAGRIDYDKIDILKTMDLEPYRKPSSSYWEIRFSKCTQ